VLKATGTTVTVFDRGAAIPLELKASTKLEGLGSMDELKAGDQVRAHFDVKQGSNELTSLTRVG
jgi:hypothetical protein